MAGIIDGFGRGRKGRKGENLADGERAVLAAVDGRGEYVSCSTPCVGPHGCDFCAPPEERTPS